MRASIVMKYFLERTNILQRALNAIIWTFERMQITVTGLATGRDE